MPGVSPRASETGVLAAVLSAVQFGAMGVLARFAYAAGADPFTLLFLRCALATGALAAAMSLTGVRLPRGRALVNLILLGALGFVGQSLAFFLALTLIPPGLVTLLLYLYPSLIVLFVALRKRRTPPPAQICGLVLAFSGVALTVQPLGSANLRGVGLAVLTAFIWAAYVLAGDRAIARAGMLPGVTVIVGSAACVYAALASARGLHFPMRADGWLAIAAIGLLCTAGATLCLFAAVRRIGPSRVSMLSFVEPVFALGLSAAVLGEPVGWQKLAGGALIAGALLLSARQPAVPPVHPI